MIRLKTSFFAPAALALLLASSLGALAQEDDQPKPTQQTTNIQKKTRNNGRYFPDFTGEVSSQGRKASRTIAAPSAQTPASLSGIARRIA